MEKKKKEAGTRELDGGRTMMGSIRIKVGEMKSKSCL